ncbi:Cytochrome c oxidase subunit 5b-2 mitochondrial -like protein [Tripterygium wilfordii]|uniref:Cytochrome c oxidase subunit 5b-2 mitochondrial -like protein n=1 Tax=Tripterygium wilfordii TaxID=458696 RepID=A0A7J7CZ66_TRIWF|nr:cytochrome c oxidase subunit 5b-1, mitochondrial-like isoform X2 [Tripterygium wilfordii]KAF5739116.1 Cytochrome c oxidase subunit 5b-2 mitochondrial -like protein [Tripterygium wilfordii]
MWRMWRRVVSSHLKTLAPSWRSALVGKSTSHAYALSANRSILSHSAAFLNRNFSSNSGSSVKKKVEDVVPIATGHEREELEAELEGKDILDINFPVGPFGTKESPAVIKSYYDKRIVGCPGGEGEDEHDVVWFWLEKGKPHECPVCSQSFVLEVVGPGGPPDGHGDDDHEHH